MITMAARFKAWNAFDRSNTGIVGSNPTRDTYVCVFSVFVLSWVGSGCVSGWTPVQGACKIHVSRLIPMEKRPEGQIER
jgi:hypothetical protein